MGSLTRTAHAGFGLLLAAAAIVGVFGHSVPHARSSGPTVQLDQGTFLGNATANVTQFLGIPYAIPPYVLGLSHRGLVVFELTDKMLAYRCQC